MEKTYKDIISLIKVSLGENNISKNNFTKTNFKEIYNISYNNQISNLVFYGIEKLNLKLDNELYKTFEEERDNNIILNIKQEEEWKLIKKSLTKENIDYALMKGFTIKKLYPTNDMRTMGDIDILIKNKDRSKLKKILINLGYNSNNYKKCNEDTYSKLGGYEIEIHTELFETNSIYYQNYKNPWKNILYKEKNNKNSYSFKIDDQYIFIITHFAKHYFCMGAGFRNIIDIYLFRKKYQNQMNINYINNKLKEFNLTEFEKDILNLIDVCFYNKEENNRANEMLSTIFSSGIYGTDENAMTNGLKQYNTKLNYILRKLFPEQIKMKNHYPILNKIIILLPIFYIVRWIRLLIKYPQNIKREIKRLKTNQK